MARIPALTILGLLWARQRLDGAGNFFNQALSLALPTHESERLVPGPRGAGRVRAAAGPSRGGACRGGRRARNPPRPNRFWDGELLRVTALARGRRRRRPAEARLEGGGRRPARAADARRVEGRRGGLGPTGLPYERADALAGGDVAAKEEALQVFLSLGAAAAADRVRQDLRRVGVTRLQRGPRKSTREERWLAGR